MAHPDPKRGGSEKGQREHSGPTTERSDAGTKQGGQGGAGGRDTMSDGTMADSASDTKRGHVAPEVHGDHDGAFEGGMDRDSGAGATAGHDRGGAPAARDADTSRGGVKSNVGKR